MNINELLKKWKGNQRYTLKLLEAMPEEDYAYKPLEGIKTFKSQATHITTWLRTHSRFVTGQEMPKPATNSKAAIVLSLQEFFEALLDFLAETDAEALAEHVEVWYGKVSKESILLTMDNHLSHHRGQMVIYLRYKGIKPPSYVGW